MRWLLLTLCLCELTFCVSCNRSDTKPVVVLYTSVDQPVAAEIIREFEAKSGIKVILQTDAEATKSAGLAERLRAEKANPQADVWWGNEIFHTINLASDGVLAPYDPPAAADVPAMFKDAEHRWCGSALRARVLAVASDRADITGLHDLTRPELKGKIAMARPTAGTTGGHVAALYVLWGEPKFVEYFESLRANEIKLLGGNSLVAEAVANGSMLAGLTDNDDCDAALANGGKLKLVLPDQDTIGTLTIPCTIALVAGAKHDAAAKKLIDYLASTEVEQKLIAKKFARYSVRSTSEPAIKSMPIDYAAAAKAMPQAVRKAMSILENR
jgi:iron(III) transport system substrate-binding protein